MKRDDMTRCERLLGQLDSLYEECANLAKQQHDGKSSVFKKVVAADVLGQAHALLPPTHQPFASVPALDTDTDHSDLTIVIGQYRGCVRRLRADHVRQRHGKWYWVIESEDPAAPGPVYLPEGGLPESRTA